MLSRTTSDPRSLMVSDYQLSYQLIPSAHVTDGSCQDLTAVPSALPIALSPLEKTTISLCTYGSSTLLARNEWTTTTQRRVHAGGRTVWLTIRDDPRRLGGDRGTTSHTAAATSPSQISGGVLPLPCVRARGRIGADIARSTRCARRDSFPLHLLTPPAETRIVAAVPVAAVLAS